AGAARALRALQGRAAAGAALGRGAARRLRGAMARGVARDARDDALGDRIPARRRRPARCDAHAGRLPSQPHPARAMSLDVVTFGEAMLMLVADRPGPIESVESFHK